MGEYKVKLWVSYLLIQYINILYPFGKIQQSPKIYENLQILPIGWLKILSHSICDSCESFLEFQEVYPGLTSSKKKSYVHKEWLFSRSSGLIGLKFRQVISMILEKVFLKTYLSSPESEANAELLKKKSYVRFDLLDIRY